MSPLYRFYIANDSSDILKDAAITYNQTITGPSSGALGYVTKAGSFVAKTSIPSATKLVFPKKGIDKIGGVIRGAVANISGLTSVNSYIAETSQGYEPFYLSGTGKQGNLPPAYMARPCFPLYDDKLSIKYAKESKYKFFRKSLDGKLKFVKDDYDYIMSASLGSYNVVIIEKSNDGKNWEAYYLGYFMRTDCNISPSDKIIETKLKTLDAYDDVIAGLAKEYNLIKLAPEVAKVQMVKRPILQVYSPGESVVSSYLPGGVYWEQECEAISDTVVLNNEHGFYKYGDVEGRTFYTRVIHDNPNAETVNIGIKNKAQFGDFYNYRYATPYSLSGLINIWGFSDTSSEPTEYGQKQPGEYYRYPQVPMSAGVNPWFPVSKTTWGDYSYWLANPYQLDIMSQTLNRIFTLKHAYPLSSCISRLLEKVAPAVTHKNSEEYSRFLYGQYNPISGESYDLLITQATNILKGEYDQPAQKMLIKLEDLFNLLRDCFRVYWYIDGDKLCLEHELFFDNGGSYNESTLAKYDTTTLLHPRSKKPWSTLEADYEFELDKMPERYEFKWADNSAKPFEGYPLNILESYVKKGQVENISIAKFSTDLDFMIANPENFNVDNNVLIAGLPLDALLSSSLTSGTLAPTDVLTLELLPIENITARSHRLRLYSRVATDVKVQVSRDAAGKSILAEYQMSLAAYKYATLDILKPATGLFIRVINAGSVSAYITASVTYLDTFATYTRSIQGSLAYTYFKGLSIQEEERIDYSLQNGHLAFANLVPQFYIYNLPSTNVEINNVPLEQLMWDGEFNIPENLRPGKFKTQTIKMPASLHDIDTSALVRTSLGLGAVDEVKINLSSRIAEIALRHDLEPRNYDDEYYE